LRSTPTSRWNPLRSQAIAIPLKSRVHATEKPAHLADGADRDELDPVFIPEDLQLFSGLERQSLPDLLVNDDLELRRDCSLGHNGPLRSITAPSCSRLSFMSPAMGSFLRLLARVARPVLRRACVDPPVDETVSLRFLPEGGVVVT